MSRWITPWRVGVVQCAGHVGRDAHRLIDAELGLAIELAAECLALDVGHRVPEGEQNVG